MYDVIFVNTIFNNVKIAEPLGISYLASTLRNSGYTVKIIEPLIEGWTIEETIEELSNYKFKILGLSVNIDKNMPNALEFIKQIRMRKVDAFICIGGHGPSLGVVNNLEIYREVGRLIHCYVIGEGELSFLELAKAIINREGDWKRVPGVAYMDNDKFVINNTFNKIGNLDKIPFMARDVLKEFIKRYGGNLPASILLSRGCAYSKCTYCTVAAYEKLQKGTCYRQRTIENIIEEIKYLHYEFNISNFNFEDDNFILPGKIGEEKVKKFCKLISDIDFKVNFTFFCRADAVNKEIFTELSNVGLIGLYLGIESISDETLGFFSKGLTKEKIIKTLDILEELGYSTQIDSKKRVMVGYILWHPLTTLNELKQTLEFIQHYRMPHKLLTRRLLLYTGSQIISDLKQAGLLHQSIKKGWKYKYEWMKLLELASTQYIDMVDNTARDKLRTLEKSVTMFNKSYPLIDKIKQYRIYLDNQCFEFFNGLINMVEETEIKTIENLSIIINEYLNIEIDKFNKYLINNDIKKKISDGLMYFSLPENSLDVFRK